LVVEINPHVTREREARRSRRTDLALLKMRRTMLRTFTLGAGDA